MIVSYAGYNTHSVADIIGKSLAKSSISAQGSPDTSRNPGSEE
jgi:hypothetical protein